MNDAVLVIVALAALGFGAYGYRELTRRLRDCQAERERLLAERAALQAALVRHGRHEDAQRRELAKWPEDYLGGNHHGEEAPA